MKQHITPKQAKELTKEKFYELFPDLVIRNDWSNYHHKKITIGKMLEVLKEHNIEIEIKIVINKPVIVKDLSNNKEYYDMELSNILWKIIISFLNSN